MRGVGIAFDDRRRVHSLLSYTIENIVNSFGTGYENGQVLPCCVTLRSTRIFLFFEWAVYVRYFLYVSLIKFFWCTKEGYMSKMWIEWRRNALVRGGLTNENRTWNIWDSTTISNPTVSPTKFSVLKEP